MRAFVGFCCPGREDRFILILRVHCLLVRRARTLATDTLTPTGRERRDAFVYEYMVGRNLNKKNKEVGFDVGTDRRGQSTRKTDELVVVNIMIIRTGWRAYAWVEY